MKTKEIKQYLKKYLSSFFKQHGFIISYVNDLGYEIVKEDKNVRYICTCNKYFALNGIAFDAFSIEIVFEDIVNVLKNILDKYGLEESQYTLRNYDNSEGTKQYRRDIRSIDMDTESDFVRYTDAVTRYCNLVVFPFFNKYSSIESLHELIKEIPEGDLGYHIGGEFQFKKMIIMKWCNNPDYDNYTEYVKQLYESIKDKEDGRYIPDLRAYYELATRLKDNTS